MNTSETEDVQKLISFINRIKDRLHEIVNKEIPEDEYDYDYHFELLREKQLARDLLKEFFNE